MVCRELVGLPSLSCEPLEGQDPIQYVVDLPAAAIPQAYRPYGSTKLIGLLWTYAYKFGPSVKTDGVWGDPTAKARRIITLTKIDKSLFRHHVAYSQSPKDMKYLRRESSRQKAS